MKRKISYYSVHHRKILEVDLHEAKGFWKLFFKVSGHGAITLPGRVVIVMPHHLYDEDVIKHELDHVEQMERDGDKRFLWRYFTGLLRYGYKDHPYEKDTHDQKH